MTRDRTATESPTERSLQPSELRLRRRKQRVIVRTPVAPEASLEPDMTDRRAQLPTLMGLGTRERLPTLFDEDSPAPPTARARIHAICDLDPLANDALLREAERLSQCFDWDND